MKERPRKLLDQVRDVVRVRHYSYRTEETYVYWIRRFILFHNKRHPNEMGVSEVEAFLTHLAVDGQVAVATQNQAFNAVLFLYNHVLQQPLERPVNALRAKRSQTLPTVLTPGEVLVISHSKKEGLMRKPSKPQDYPGERAGGEHPDEAMSSKRWSTAFLP